MREFLILVAACAVFSAFIALVIGIFEVEENWRGAQAWSGTQNWLKAQGETTQWKDLIPAAVPDDQNLGALDLFRVVPDSANDGILEPLPLKRALENVFPNHGYRLPNASQWTLGQPTDFKNIQSDLSHRYDEIFHSAGPTPNDPLSNLDALCPALNEIRAAAATRPFCRFDRDYTSVPAFNRPFGATTKLLSVAKAFDLHATLALYERQPDLALADIETTLKIDAGVRKEPVLVSGLVADAVMVVQIGSIWEGLRLHSWNDAQLSRLQSGLKNTDFLSDEQLCLRGEALDFYNPTADWFRDHRLSGAKMFLGLSNNSPPLVRLLAWLAPRGWFDLGKCTFTRFLFLTAETDVDPRARRVYPDQAALLDKQIDDIPLTPWNLLPRIALGPMGECTPAFAEGQSRTDMARIACMLERYRIAHGSYPDSLEDLRPYDPEGAPRDIMNGDPFHYRRQPDGTFLLYSVGWNQTDDGGQPAHKPGPPKVLDREHGDWVWPAP